MIRQPTSVRFLFYLFFVCVGQVSIEEAQNVEEGFSPRTAGFMGFQRLRSYSNSYTICRNNRALLIDVR